MRVIAGKYKGRILACSKSASFRPTLDRVRESIFNVLAEDIIDRQALDLFCGSGSLGIEALSRGAMRVVFVDSIKKNIEFARRNVEALHAGHKSKFIIEDAFRYLEQQGEFGFDMVFADPPYDLLCGSRLCRLLSEKNVLKQGGIFILERFKKDTPEFAGFRCAKTLKFGQTEVDFYIREEEDEDRSLPGHI
jgi:16S rRNA (guanine966-N2)-methyltransferase